MEPKPTPPSEMRPNMTHLINMITTVIFLLGVSWPAMVAPFTPPQTCITIFEILDPCFPQNDPSAPIMNTSPACCKAAATLSNQGNEKTMCECIKDVQEGGPLDLTALGILFSSCHVSVELPPISKDMDCSQ